MPPSFTNGLTTALGTTAVLVIVASQTSAFSVVPTSGRCNGLRNHQAGSAPTLHLLFERHDAGTLNSPPPYAVGGRETPLWGGRSSRRCDRVKMHVTTEPREAPTTVVGDGSKQVGDHVSLDVLTHNYTVHVLSLLQTTTPVVLYYFSSFSIIVPINSNSQCTSYYYRLLYCTRMQQFLLFLLFLLPEKERA